MELTDDQCMIRPYHGFSVLESILLLCKIRRRECRLHAAEAEGVPLPCKPDSVPPLRSWTAISLTPPERSALLAQSATNTRRLKRTGRPSPVLSCTTRGLPCRPVTRIRGGLLLHHFTLACDLAAHRRYLSAALSVRVPRGSRPSLS